MYHQQRERIEERKTEISSVLSQSDLSLQDLPEEKRIMYMKKIKTSSVSRKRKGVKKREIGETIKEYNETLNNTQNIDTISEVDSESDREEDICITLNYFVDQEIRSIRLNEQSLPEGSYEPVSTDRIAVGTKRADDYTKWVSAIKALPNSPIRNIPINEYQKLVKKYTLLMTRILQSEEEDKEYIEDLLDNNKHVKNFIKEKKITFEFFEFKQQNDHLAEFIFHLNDHLKFKNAKFDELPIKYAITATNLEIYGIWFNQSLKTEIERHYFQIWGKQMRIKNKFNLNCLPKAVLVHPLFDMIKAIFFHSFVINVNTMLVEVEEGSQDQEFLQKIWRKLNKVLTTKFNLKWFDNMNPKIRTEEYKKIFSLLLCYPPEVNWLNITDPNSIKKNYIDFIDNFSIFKLLQRWHNYFIYNCKEQLSKDQVIQIINRYMKPLFPVDRRKFSFRDTTEMKNFVIKHHQDWKIEILGMNNKTCPRLFAILFGISGEEWKIQNNFECLRMETVDIKPLILTDLDQLRLLEKLTGKTCTENELVQLKLIRQEVPNFYKNINVIYSWQFREVFNKLLPIKYKVPDYFSDGIIEFHFEIEEADEVYLYKKDKTQEALTKILNNVEWRKISNFHTESYYTSNGRFPTQHEQIWMKSLIANMKSHYWLVDYFSAWVFEMRRFKFNLHFQANKIGPNYSFKFTEWNDQVKSNFHKDQIQTLKVAHEYFDLIGWSHWKKIHPPNSEEKYVTRRERFAEENQKARKIIKNIKNWNFIDYVHNTWRNHTMPTVFANMKKEVGYLNTQNTLIDMFDHRSLEISFSIFIEYFTDDEIREKFFDQEDYEIDDEKESITIENWLMIPVLGILRMMDDYKNGCLKQGFKFEPYATFADPKHEKSCAMINRNQIRKGECRDFFNLEFHKFSNYEKNYEITNWNAYLVFNGVKYFYFVQDKHSSIIIKEVWTCIKLYPHHIYKFLFSSNPIDLITIVLRYSHHPEERMLNIISASLQWLNLSALPCAFWGVYKQIYIKEDTIEHRLLSKNLNPLPQLHFPAVLPTYAFFNDTIRDHLETEYEQVVKWFTSSSFKSIFECNEQRKLDEDIRWLLDNSKFILDIVLGMIEWKTERINDNRRKLKRNVGGLIT
jgi:hypothetical protein